MIEGAVADFEQRETDREPINMLIPSNFRTIPSVFYPSPNWFICFVTSVFSRLYLQRASGNFGAYGACFFFLNLETTMWTFVKIFTILVCIQNY